MILGHRRKKSGYAALFPETVKPQTKTHRPTLQPNVCCVTRRGDNSGKIFILSCFITPPSFLIGSAGWIVEINNTPTTHPNEAAHHNSTRPTHFSGPRDDAKGVNRILIYFESILTGL